MALIIFNILSIITSKCKYYPKELARYCNQCLYFGCTIVQHLLILRVHNSMGLHRINSSKKQKFSYQGPAPFRNTMLPFMLSGADFKQIKPGKFHYLRYCLEFPEVTNFSYQAGSRYIPNTFDGQYTVTVRNLVQVH